MECGIASGADPVEKQVKLRIPNRYDGTLPTVKGKIVSASHELQIFVKHDVWNQWGSKGKAFKLPIILVRRPAVELAQG